MSKRAEEKAIDAWAVYEYREHPKGLYHTRFVDGYKEGYEQAEKDMIERAMNVLNKQIDDLIYSRLTIGDFLKQFRKAMEKE